MTTIIVGLGNPGEKFKNTRHNVGFMVLDKFAKKNDFPEFKLQKKSNALVSESIVGEEKIILVKPQTFMNESGKAVKKIIGNWKEPYGESACGRQMEIGNSLVVIHDDIDLAIGKIKIVKERGSAGHKGVESIIKNIGNDGLIRFRIGISGQKDMEAKKIVLKKFTKEEQKNIDKAIEKTTEALDFLLKSGFEKTMNEYNR